MHANWCVLIEISMETGMLKFLLGLLVSALMKETCFNWHPNCFVLNTCVYKTKQLRSQLVNQQLVDYIFVERLSFTVYFPFFPLQFVCIWYTKKCETILLEAW